MSIVLATASIMAADCRVSDESGARCLPQVKISRNKYLIAGGVGMLTATLAIREAILRGARTPDELCEHLDEASEALCLYKGRIYLIDPTHAAWTRKTAYAVGSGADAALGYLAGARTHSLASCRAAVRFASTRRADCGDGVRVLQA